MALIGRRRSYSASVESRKTFLRRLLMVILAFALFDTFMNSILSTYEIRSVAMSPSLRPGDRIAVFPLPYGPRTIFGKLPGVMRPRRGDLVLVSPPFGTRHGAGERILDSVVRFLTLQRVSTLGGGASPPSDAPVVKRVIGIPGDTVSMAKSVFMVRPEGDEFFLTEFERSARPYDAVKGAAPEGWVDGLPGSGVMAPVTLAGDEYFVAGDSRADSSDSRHWGPVKAGNFMAVVMLRYWPLSRFGKP